MASIEGLRSVDAQKKLAEFGPNQIFKPSKISFLEVAKHELTEPMILLLLVVGIFYSIWGELRDAITIFAIISALVFVEVYNEFRAKKAIASLEKIAAPKTRVIRDGKTSEIDSDEVVPGDMLVLTPGTRIAADARIEKSIGLQVDESALTGESAPIDKNKAEEINAGTIVVAGEGIAQVFSTGKNTRFGQIAATLKEIKPPKTPLQLAMKSLAAQLVYVALFFSISIPLLGILRGQDFKTMVLTGLSLSFATIPEELPIVITMVLGLGSYTLSKNKFLIKRLKAAETLGNATVIVTDKTGTITEGKMKVAHIYPAGKRNEIIKGALSAMPDYSLSVSDEEIKNTAKQLRIRGNVGEIFRQRGFGDGRKIRAVIRKDGKGYSIFAIGAPEEIFKKCSKITNAVREDLNNETSTGRRVIAVAHKKLRHGQENHSFSKLETGMIFSGLISFNDPARKGVKETIATVARAGIRTIMVTGDHPTTAGVIAKQVGILTDDTILTGKDLDGMPDNELKEAVKKVSVFARTTPEHKYRIVKALQENGEVVAVSGDGINDALALKQADIGIAMGIKGTDVAKEAAEVVLADDNYITITQGVFEGRTFFDNLKKGIKYYLSVKTALILIFLLPVLLGVPMPFSPIQIIILELFMDLAASSGFVAEPKEKNIYSRPPRNPQEKIINKSAVTDILVKGVFLFIAVMAVYFWANSQNLDLKQTQTFAFSAWIIGHIILALVSRSDKEFLISQGLFTNKVIVLWAAAALAFLVMAIYIPALNGGFNLAPIEPTQLGLAGIAVTIIIGSLELRKKLTS